MTTKVKQGVIADDSVGADQLKESDAAAIRALLALAGTGAANVFTETQQIKSTDAGATAGPTLELYRDSASPAAADDIGQISFQGEDSGGALENYARIKAIITDPTAASEDAKIALLTVIAGTLAARFNIGAGLWAEGVTGGDPGAGKINVTELQIAGASLPFTKSYTSSNQTVTAGGTLTLPHSLGAMPTLVQCRLKCTTGELGYSIGDEVIVNPGPAYVSSSTGLSVVPDATNVVIRFGSSGGGVAVVRKDTGALAIITAANWVLIVKAWA